MNRPSPWVERPDTQPRIEEQLMTDAQPVIAGRAAPVALVVLTAIVLGYALGMLIVVAIAQVMS